MKKVEKTCKNCGVKFSLECEINGKGSTAKLRQNFCSRKCSAKHSQRSDVGSKIELICNVCGIHFFRFKSGRNRKSCSNACRFKFAATIAKKNPIFYLNCLFCKKQFETNNDKRKYCSEHCFNLSQCDRTEVKCELCGKINNFKKSYAKTARFCSKLCVYQAQSKGMIKSHVNGRSGYRLDLNEKRYFKSSFEADYNRYCDIINVKTEYEFRTFEIDVNGKKKFYTPDFYLPQTDEFIELKGIKLGESKYSKLINSNSEARELLSKQGLIKISVLYMNDFYKMLKESDLYLKIPNLEQRNYAITKKLIVKHEKN